MRGTAKDGRVRCELGEVEAMLRPEEITLLSEEDPRSANASRATVCGHEFYGQDQIIRLRLDSGTGLRYRLGPGPGFRPGARVGVLAAGPAVAYQTG